MNLAEILNGHPDGSVALLWRGEPITYGTLTRQVDGMRAGLVGLGLQPGDRVAVLAANNRYFVVSYFAILGAGCVAVPLNPTSPTIEVARQLQSINARAIVVGPRGSAAFAEIDRASLPGLEHVIATAGSDAVGALVFEDLEGTEPVPMVERAATDLAVLVFTAGTGGSPKAAMLTHGSLRANLQQVQQVPARRQLTTDVILGVLPFFHIFGLHVVLTLSLASGGTTVLSERFDPVTALDTIRDRGITVVAGAPPMWQAWASMSSAPSDAFATVRMALSGASKLPVDVIQAVRERFGVTIHEGYGLTEASPVVTSAVGGHSPPGSIGRPIPGVEVRIVDSDGNDTLLGDAGELWVRGPNVFPGYWNDPEATGRALTGDGWLRTGDVAVADEDGFLYIVDRAKDLIIVSGFNVYPAEVEDALLEHPGVEAVAVVGVEHPYSGEAVKAYVVPAAGHALEEDDVIEFAAQRLARYKCPTKVLFVDEIPHGMGGKVLRRQLKTA